MKAIDSMLRILVLQGGAELRFASDHRPQMFKEGIELPLTILGMSTERIRELLGDLWTAHEPELRECGRRSFSYRSAELRTFAVELVQPDASRLEVRRLGFYTARDTRAVAIVRKTISSSGRRAGR